MSKLRPEYVAGQSLRLWFSGVVVSKKNSKVIRLNHQTGQRFITSNSVAKQNEAAMVAQFREQVEQIKGYCATAMSPCAIEFRVWEPDYKRRDLDNQITSVLDALVKAEVLNDDSIGTLRGIMVNLEGIDPENPRVEIVIRKVQKDCGWAR